MLPEHFLVHYLGLKKKYYVPHCKERPSVSHITYLFLKFFLLKRVHLLSASWHLVRWNDQRYFWNGSCVFTPVFCSPLMELHVLSYVSPLLIWKSAVTFYLLLRFSKALQDRYPTHAFLRLLVEGGCEEKDVLGWGWFLTQFSAVWFCS